MIGKPINKINKAFSRIKPHFNLYPLDVSDPLYSRDDSKVTDSTTNSESQNVGVPEAEVESVEDPLAQLYQLDKIECTPLEKEALVLVTCLLQNIEEYYVLQGQIKEVLAKDAIVDTKIKALMDALIRGLIVEETFL
jgi:hypothetical protein